ncbi:MAG: hypothetical protein ACYSR1_10480, partial [Planctomycetota bacterium]
MKHGDASDTTTISSEDREILAYLLEQEAQGGTPQRIPRRAEPGDAPPSFAQRRLWLVDRLSDQRAPYTITIALRARGRLDLEA